MQMLKKKAAKRNFFSNLYPLVMREHVIFSLTALIIGAVLVVLSTVPLTFLYPVKPLDITRSVTFHDIFETSSESQFDASQAIAFLPTTFRSSIDGKKPLYYNPSREQVVAVMIENHPDSRAQMSGLASASIVYETIAEGTITRFLAIFNNFTRTKVGPVRSARPYFVDFAEEYRAPYAHAGGSPPALEQVHSGKVLNVEALYLEEVTPYFKRDRKYYAPHNMFGSLPGIIQYRDKKGWDKPIGAPRFLFEDADVLAEQLKDAEGATTINVRFSNAFHQVRYEYDAEKQHYNRFLAGKAHIDKGVNRQITPTNILVQETTYYPYDEYGRLKMVTKGKNTAWLFTLGKAQKGYWEKRGSGFTKFYAENGEEFMLAPGNTWIEVIKPKRVTFE